MSLAIVRSALASPLPSTEKLVLVAMAMYADRDGSSVYPSLGRIQADTSFGKTAVKGAISALKVRGILVEVARHQHRKAEWTIVAALIPAREAAPMGREAADTEEPYESPRGSKDPAYEPGGDCKNRVYQPSGGSKDGFYEPRGDQSMSRVATFYEPPGDPSIQRNTEPMTVPVDRTSSTLGDEDEVWNFLEHPDPEVSAFASAVSASARWGAGHMPDRLACENLIAASRRVIAEAGKAPSGLRPVLVSFGERYRSEPPRPQDSGPGYALSEFVRYRVPAMPDAAPAPEPTGPPPKVAEPPERKPVGYVVSPLGGGKVLPIFDGDPRAATAFRTRRAAEDELVASQGAPDVAPSERAEDVDARRIERDRQIAALRRGAA